MKQLNRCPNCGGLLPKSRTNTVKCEYCDSVFENFNYDNSNEEVILYADDKVYTKAIKPLDEKTFYGTMEEWISLSHEEQRKYGEVVFHAPPINAYPLRDVDGKITLDMGYMTPHSNACNTKNIQLESGHTVTRLGSNYVVHANSPKDNMKDLMAEMKKAVLKHKNITMPRGVNPFVKMYVETLDRIDDSYRLPDTIEKQWKVRCLPW